MKRAAVLVLVASPLIGALGFLVVGCMTAPTMTAVISDYAPLVVGNYWRYEFTTYTGSTSTISYQQWTAQNQETKNGKTAWHIVVKNTDANGNVLGGFAADQYWFYDDANLQMSAFYSDCQWITVLEAPPIENTKWNYTCSFSPLASTLNFVTKARETVTLSNNTSFDNSGKVVETETDTLGGSSTVRETDYWFAPNVGLVKLETWDRTPGSTTYNTMTQKQELIAYNVVKPGT